MGNKYIIELEDKPFHNEDGDSLCRVKGFNSLVFDMTGISKLAHYHEPDLEQVRKEAYDEGYDDAKGGYKNGFENGMIVAWEAVRKIYDISQEDRLEIFPEASTFVVADICDRYSASECIEKIRQYEEKKEIKVGDEVIRHYKNEFMEGDDAPSIFLSEEDGHFRCLAFNGRSIMIAEYPKNQYRKTGRHFPEIAEVLAKMKESDNG